MGRVCDSLLKDAVASCPAVPWSIEVVGVQVYELVLDSVEHLQSVV